MDRREFALTVISPAAFTAVLFLLWEIVCKVFAVPLTILPAPSDVFAALWQYRAPIVDNAWVTLWTTVAGFLIATDFGLGLGIAKAFVQSGVKVLVGSRTMDKVEGAVKELQAIPGAEDMAAGGVALDVTNEASAERAVRKAIDNRDFAGLMQMRKVEDAANHPDLQPLLGGLALEQAMDSVVYQRPQPVRLN